MIHVIDDDASVRVAFRRVLVASGLQARDHGSMEEFLRAGSSPGDCLVVDAGVAHAAGASLPALPLVLVSGREPELVAPAVRARATAFLAKPVDSRVLLDAIARALARTG